MTSEKRKPVALRRLSLLLFAMAVLGVAISSGAQQAADKGLEGSIRLLETRAKEFRPRFERAIRESNIGKNSGEQKARRLIRSFEKQTQELRENFERTKKVGDLAPLFNTANQITGIVYRSRLGGQQKQDWQELRAELTGIANVADVAPPQSPSCEKTIGLPRARELVKQCLQVSPATHPPCNVQNSCDLIIDEITRGCGFLTSNAPGFCPQRH
jgi:hypothetical protein